MKLPRRPFLALVVALCLDGRLPAQSTAPAAGPGPTGAAEPVRYTGELQPAKTHYDGRVPHALGVHSIQAFRANRAHPPAGGPFGFTYNHQPYLAYWNGRFYLQFLSAVAQEHEPPTNTSVMTSEDGYSWSPPRVVFPEYQLPAFERDGVSYPAGMYSVMHQRMGFYVAPGGRLLTFGFYGYCPTPQTSPNAGNGLGRVVREIHADGSFGPIYFIRYNRHAGWNESNTSYPFYRTSPDTGFVAACDAIMADKLFSLQWWEEDRAEDGFYRIKPDAVAGAAVFNANIVTAAGAGKAFTWFTRGDGVVVGLWKNQYSALTTDRGQTWTPIVKNTTLLTTGAKTWGQRTDDGRYVIVHNHSATMANRFPASALVGADGQTFDTLMVLQGEVPPRRFRGQFKETGQNYFRGISEGNGNPPGDHLWVTYSMNKEDIWVSRAHVPLADRETSPLQETFESSDALERWNLHLPQWAPTRVVAEAGTTNHVLELRDEEPYDYALAERLLPAARRLHVSFRVQVREAQLGSTLEIEVQTQRSDRPMRLRLNRDWLAFDRGPRPNKQVRLSPQRWYAIGLDFDCEQQTYSLSVDGTVVQAGIAFAEKAERLERIAFRTGPWRGLVPPEVVERGGEKPGGLSQEDLPGADERAAPAVFWIDDLKTR
ncbi:MAG TPA: hypothetical protein VGD97_07675 [Lacunisphaera sp.]